MAVGPVGSTTTPYQTMLSPLQPETLEQRTAGGRDAKIDGDADDGAVNTNTATPTATTNPGTAQTAASQPQTPRPTVNTQGQVIGQVLNTTA